MEKELNKLFSNLQDAPVEVKVAYNELSKYFSRGAPLEMRGIEYKDPLDPKFLKERKVKRLELAKILKDQKVKSVEKILETYGLNLDDGLAEFYFGKDLQMQLQVHKDSSDIGFSNTEHPIAKAITKQLENQFDIESLSDIPHPVMNKLLKSNAFRKLIDNYKKKSPIKVSPGEFEGISYSTKDATRIQSIIDKAKGSKSKESQYCAAMAKSITDKDKILSRYAAAGSLLGDDHEGTAIFKDRAVYLGAIDEDESVEDTAEEIFDEFVNNFNNDDFWSNKDVSKEVSYNRLGGFSHHNDAELLEMVATKISDFMLERGFSEDNYGDKYDVSQDIDTWLTTRVSLKTSTNYGPSSSKIFPSGFKPTKLSLVDFVNKNLPSSGGTKHQALEIIRAVNKILYRYFNDGDVPFDIFSPTYGAFVYVMTKVKEIELRYEDADIVKSAVEETLTEMATYGGLPSHAIDGYGMAMKEDPDNLVRNISGEPMELVTAAIFLSKLLDKGGLDSSHYKGSFDYINFK